MNSRFGRMLWTIAQNRDYTSFLEVGTWKGLGSTLCVVDGIYQRLTENPDEELNFWSFETNIEFYKEAVARYPEEQLPFLHLVYGKLHKDGLMTKEEIEADPDFNDVKDHYELWYEQDIIDYTECPFLDPKLLPDQIDVLILDGGEFSGYADWLALKDKSPSVVCLDDINVMKNKRLFHELKSSMNWKLVAAENDRNGWAIFERVYL